MLIMKNDVIETNFSENDLLKKPNLIQISVFNKLEEMICFGQFASITKIKIKGYASDLIACSIKNMLIGKFEEILIFKKRKKKFVVFKTAKEKQREKEKSLMEKIRLFFKEIIKKFTWIN